MQISAILSDYDGTLCPTAFTGSAEENTAAIPEKLENILWNISEKIPVCIVSSKDLNFLHNKTKFANILSCILGIETVVLKRHSRSLSSSSLNSKEAGISSLPERISECQNFKCIKNNYLSIDRPTLEHNSKILSQLVEEISSNFKEVSIELKYAITGQKTLAGITIDWRHIDDWKLFKIQTEPQLRKVLAEKKQRQLDHAERSNIFIQTYTTHPFIDIYAAKCDKAIAYDSVLSEISTTTNSPIQSIMYLGDSENDNPAFKKADISIGVRSDERLDPKLDCKYTMKFDKLAGFLEKMQSDSLVFSGV